MTDPHAAARAIAQEVLDRRGRYEASAGALAGLFYATVPGFNGGAAEASYAVRHARDDLAEFGIIRKDIGSGSRRRFVFVLGGVPVHTPRGGCHE